MLLQDLAGTNPRVSVPVSDFRRIMSHGYSSNIYKKQVKKRARLQARLIDSGGGTRRRRGRKSNAWSRF